MRLRVGAATNRGRVRELNEDVYIARAAQGLFVVCDGMGGAPDGEVASRIAAETILRELDGAPRSAVPARTEECGYLPETCRLAEAVRFSNEVIYRQGRPGSGGAAMGTTVVGAWINHHIASVAHVGDSRAYLWHDRRLHALTRDHSLAELLVRDGEDDSARSLTSDEQNTLVRVLGGEPDVQVDLKEVPVQPGDYLLLCSDGLTRMVPEPAVCDAISRIREPQRVCDHLIDIANRNGGADNVTVVIIEVVDSWWRWLATQWTRQLVGAPVR
jgi:serine/threonine protein phosphatase PrpC